jgi:hypothetical protein
MKRLGNVNRVYPAVPSPPQTRNFIEVVFGTQMKVLLSSVVHSFQFSSTLIRKMKTWPIWMSLGAYKMLLTGRPIKHKDFLLYPVIFKQLNALLYLFVRNRFSWKDENIAHLSYTWNIILIWKINSEPIPWIIYFAKHTEIIMFLKLIICMHSGNQNKWNVVHNRLKVLNVIYSTQFSSSWEDDSCSASQVMESNR